MDEDYYFNIDEVCRDEVFVLIIYDIEENKKRVRLAKFLQGYGFRVQKSAFEAVLSKKKYEKLISELPIYVNKRDNDSIRVYKIIGKGQMTCFGAVEERTQEDVIVV